MDLNPQADRKDKRLLVLLGFGTLILAVDLLALLPARQEEVPSWGWVEEAGELHRIRLQAAAGDQPAATSPRLALLLGRPFPLNRASAEEIALLDGIGPKLAGAIVRYRESHGRISDRRALQEVPGIGDKLTATLAPQLSFD